MNTKFASFALSISKINRQHIQLAIVVISLAMLILGIGAPVDGSGLTTH